MSPSSAPTPRSGPDGGGDLQAFGQARLHVHRGLHVHQHLGQDGRGPAWGRADAHYHRSDKGGGSWETRGKLREYWTIGYGETLRFKISPTGFKHTGLFPEQAVNWDLFGTLTQSSSFQTSPPGPRP